MKYMQNNDQKHIDPVCKMEVEVKEDTPSSEYQGTTYYFCALGCKQSFDMNPAKFI